MRRVYLDYNASTPLASEVKKAIRECLDENYGNPSSHHWAGRPVKERIEDARSKVASLIEASPEEIVFTSGGSEANNAAIKGAYFANRAGGKHIITTAIEHPAVLKPCAFLEKLGAKVTHLSVDGTGLVDPDDVRRAINKETFLITVMHANNEVGTIQPIADIANIAREHGILFHTDAAQSAGKIKINVKEFGVDLLSLAGHKFYAPKGIGVLFVRRGVKIDPLIHGAGHEFGLRAGTESVLLDVAIGVAAEESKRWVTDQTVRDLRDYFWEQLKREFGSQVSLNGHPTKRLPNTLNLSFKDRIGSEVLDAMEDIAASTGSACHSGEIRLSPVLAAMGISPAVGKGAIRFSLGRETTRDEIDYVVKKLKVT